MTDISKDAVERHILRIDPHGLVQERSLNADTFTLIRAQAARIEQLEAAIKRQAGAAKTLRDLTLSEVKHLKEKDRSEYVAAKTVDREREANAILTDRVEHLEAQNAALIVARDMMGRKWEAARNDALKEAAGVAYAACADTRHVKMGLSVEKNILALMTKEPNT